MIVRNLVPGERLPWTLEEIGWDQAKLDPRTVWIAEDQGEIVGLIIAAEVHQTLFLLRILGKGAYWIRPAWRAIRLASFHRKIGAFWMFADNKRHEEARLSKLLLRDADEGLSGECTLTVVAGRWNAGTNSNSVVSPSHHRHSRGGNLGYDGIRAGEPAILERLLGHRHGSDPGPGAGPGAGPADGPAEGGICRSATQRAGLDGWRTDGDGVEHGDSERSGSSIRSKLYREIFGTPDGE